MISLEVLFSVFCSRSNLLKSNAHDASHSHDKHDGCRRQQSRNIDVDHFMPFVGAVHRLPLHTGSGLQRKVCDIEDTVPSYMLPCLRPYINVWECFCTSHQVRELESKQSDQLCDNTCTRGEEQDQHSGHNNGRDEVRQVGLIPGRNFFKFRAFTG